MSKVGKRAFLLLLAIPIVINVMAQETKKPTLEDLIPGGESYRYAENLYGLQWWGDECIKPGIDTIYSIQPQTGKETMLITREQINKALAEDKAGKLSHLYSVRFPWAEKPQMLLIMQSFKMQVIWVCIIWNRGSLKRNVALKKESCLTE